MQRPDTAGSRSESVRQANLSAILHSLHLDGPATRSDLVATTGLTRSAVGALVGELTDMSFVYEQRSTSDGSPGRPSPIVRVVTDHVTIAMEVLVDSLAVAAVTLGGHVLDRRRIDRSRVEMPVDQTVHDLVDLTSELLGGLPDSLVVHGVGVAIAGVVRWSDQRVIVAPNIGWSDVPLGGLYDRFFSRLGLDDERDGLCGDVSFEVDVDSFNVFASGSFIDTSPTGVVDVDVSGALLLTLRVFDNGDACGDAGDWADARLVPTVFPGYRYYRFRSTELRDDGGADSIQLSELSLFQGASRINAFGVTNPGGNNSGNEAAGRADDANTGTKWRDLNRQQLVYEIGLFCQRWVIVLVKWPLPGQCQQVKLATDISQSILRSYQFIAIKTLGSLPQRIKELAYTLTGKLF